MKGLAPCFSTCKVQMKSSNTDCLLSLLRHRLAQKFAVTLSPQNEVRWMSDKGQKAAFGIASCKGVLGTGLVGTPSDCSHPNSTIFFPKQCSKFGVLAVMTGLWITWWKEGAESQGCRQSQYAWRDIFSGHVHGPIRWPGPCRRWMMPCWSLGAWCRKQGKMLYFIHMCLNFSSCNGRGPPWRSVSQPCCQLYRRWEVRRSLGKFFSACSFVWFARPERILDVLFPVSSTQEGIQSQVGKA